MIQIYSPSYRVCLQNGFDPALNTSLRLSKELSVKHKQPDNILSLHCLGLIVVQDGVHVALSVLDKHGSRSP